MIETRAVLRTGLSAKVQNLKPKKLYALTYLAPIASPGLELLRFQNLAYRSYPFCGTSNSRCSCWLTGH